MGSKDQIPLDIFESVGICDGAPSNVFYNSFLVYCRELDPGAVSLTGDWAQGDDSKHDSRYSFCLFHCLSAFQEVYMLLRVLSAHSRTIR